MPTEVSSGERYRNPVDVMVFSFTAPRSMANLVDHMLTRITAASNPRAMVVGSYFRNRPQEVAEVARRLFAATSVDLDVVTSKDEARNALTLIWAKLQAKKPDFSAGPKLAEVTESLAATADLRDDTGRLNIDHVAQVFDLPRAALARAVGSNSPAAAKTPNAESLQAGLTAFEAVARLRAVTRNDATFRKWLNHPNPHLENKAPLSLLIAGRTEPVIAIVNTFLTGATT